MRFNTKFILSYFQATLQPARVSFVGTVVSTARGKSDSTIIYVTDQSATQYIWIDLTHACLSAKLAKAKQTLHFQDVLIAPKTKSCSADQFTVLSTRAKMQIADRVPFPPLTSTSNVGSHDAFTIRGKIKGLIQDGADLSFSCNVCN